VSALPSALRIVPGGKTVYVPKDAMIDRVIAIEPHMNSFIQKGIGSMVRSRLLRIGIDLNDQSHNQNFARMGSKFDTYCTIDLSSASDTVSRELVELLLPENWLSIMRMSRSENVFHDGLPIYLNKWSSMGNGYTFELESLIFWALCSAVYDVIGLEHHVSLLVYGDDIICHRDSYQMIAGVLSYFGFEFNLKKSFGSGPFRESCGRDYFLGVPVRAVYLREDLQSRQALYRVANLLRRQSHSWCSNYGCDSLFKPVYDYLTKLVRSPLRGPDNYGDGFLISNLDEALPLVRRMSGQLEGFRVRSELSLPKLRSFRGRGLYTTALYLAGANQYTQGMFQPRGLLGIRVGHIQCRDWHDLGPWL
jgi:hypothetical protein